MHCNQSSVLELCLSLIIHHLNRHPHHRCCRRRHRQRLFPFQEMENIPIPFLSSHLFLGQPISLLPLGV
jgi:hypothetical protein